MSETTATTISGAVPIIPTPFDAHDEIDEDALRGMVEYCATWGFKAICLPAYGGEFVQDFYPGGVTISANFVARLVAECPNFRYIKFEEPMLSPKLNAKRRPLAESESWTAPADSTSWN